MNITELYYCISDMHFGHKNIVKYEGRPDNYNELLVKNWNQTVRKDDKVLMLGDLALTNKEDAKKWCLPLNGVKYMLHGNHDGGSDQWYKDLGFTMLPSIYKRFKDKYEQHLNVLFTHEPVNDLPEDWFNIHGHIHLAQHRGECNLTARHFNASVEVINYTPIPLYQILNGFRKYKGMKV